MLDALASYLQASPIGAQAFVFDALEETIIKRYTDGSAVKELTFALLIPEAIDFGSLQAWVEFQNLKKQYPIPPNGSHIIWLDCLSAGYLYTDSAPLHHQIKFKLIYQTGGTTR